MKILITGTAQGLGKAIVDELKNEEHEIVGLDKQQMQNTEKFESHIINMENTQKIIQFTQKDEKKKFDWVILNAGISATGKFEEINIQAQMKVINVNMTAVMIMASQLVKNNRINENGKIIIISSLAHHTAYPAGAVYAATKSAIAIYAKSIRKKFKEKNVKLMTVFPPPIDTPHAQRYAPPNAKKHNRMKPEIVARKILKDAKMDKNQCFPSTQARTIAIIAAIMPTIIAKIMKIIIYDKIKEPRL